MLRAATATSLLFLLLSFPALAHIVTSPDTASSGAWFRTNLRVTHGCEGSDTKKITVTVPKGILIIKPQVKDGWKIDVQKETLSKPVQGPHGPITQIVKSISWTGHLEDAYFDEFGLSMKLPETDKPIAFPVLQECIKGQMNWKDAPSGHSHSHDSFPAPVIKIIPAK